MRSEYVGLDLKIIVGFLPDGTAAILPASHHYACRIAFFLIFVPKKQQYLRIKYYKLAKNIHVYKFCALEVT